MTRSCWRCDAELDLPEKVPFRAVCDACGAYLHCCVACVNYQPGLPNDCRIPETDPIADRESFNFCEWFKEGREKEKRESPEDVARRLFGEE